MKYIKQDVINIGEIIADNVDSTKISNDRYFFSYYSDIDNISPIEQGDFIIIGGRPKMGKSSFGLNLLVNISMLNNSTGLFFSLKNTRKNVITDIISYESEISGNNIRNLNYAKEDWDKIMQASSRIIDLKIEIIDQIVLYTSQIEEKIKTSIAESPENEKFLIVIDDLQTLTEEKDYIEVCRKLKIMAKELNVPIILIAQLDPWVEKRQNKRPKSADLDYKGNISNYADKIWLLYRDEIYNMDTDKKRIAELTIDKNKNGRMAMIELYFDSSLKKFSSLESFPGFETVHYF